MTLYEQQNVQRIERTVRLAQRLALSRYARVLDIGPHCLTTALRQQFYRVDTLGFNPPDEFIAPRGNERHWEQDLNGIPWHNPNGSPYDLVLCCEVVEHLHLPLRFAVAELAGLIRPGCCIILTTPNAAALKNRVKLSAGREPWSMHASPRNGDVGHFREYTRTEALLAAEAQGLTLAHFEAHSDLGHSGLVGRCYNVLCSRLPCGLRDLFVYVLRRWQ